MRKHVVAWSAIIGGLTLTGIVIGLLASFFPHVLPATLYGRHLRDAVAWRAQLLVRKARGGIPDLSWHELAKMSAVQGGFGLESLIREGRGADGSVKNPYVATADRQVGRRIFEIRCAACHGSDGGGAHGPALNRPGLRHGDSDLSVYKVIRDGIPNSAMVAPVLSFRSRWQLVGYVKYLQAQSARAPATVQGGLNINVTAEQLTRAVGQSDEWITYSGSLDGRRYTPLSEINRENASRLKLRWIHQFDASDPTMESTPLAAGGVIFVTEPPSNVVAVDAQSGRAIWRYFRPMPDDLPLCCGRVNRGLAILGNKLFLGTLDGYLVAIDANNGNVIWQTQVARAEDGYSMTGAPLIAGGSVIVGVAGGEYGIRGFLDAYDPESGQRLWRFHTIPGPGETGHDTWKNDAWKTGGGPTWTAGVYDPALNLIYWGVGNPAPDYNGDVRPGDNLFTGSVIALKADTGKLAWYFQFTPHDEHDWDSNQTPVLADIDIKGARRKVICWANRNGFYYVLDRATGEFLVGVPFVDQNWAVGLDSAGRPILASASSPSQSGRLTRPSLAGGTNWQNPAFDASSGLIFIPATEGSSVFTKDSEPKRGQLGFYPGSAGSMPAPPQVVIRALEAGSGSRRWETALPPLKDGYMFSGLLATGGGLVFGAAGGFVYALDSASGKVLWSVYLGGDTRAAPISVVVDGHQAVAVSGGRSLFLFGL
jgi:alcohol dehydrogenase (cytochrome c)